MSLVTSQQLKELGKQAATESRQADLQTARLIAYWHAYQHGTVTMDDVRPVLETLDIELGPAAGSVFNDTHFVFTGSRVLSEHRANHARELKVWKLKIN